MSGSSKATSDGNGDCPTGVLIDFSNSPTISDQAPPTEILMMGEFDDTFGLFQADKENLSKLSDADSPFGLGITGAGGKDKGRSPIGKRKVSRKESLRTKVLTESNKPADPFSPILACGLPSEAPVKDSPVDPFSPLKSKRNDALAAIVQSCPPGTPVKIRRASEGNKVGLEVEAVDNLSDSEDSLLDISKLSGFSVSEDDWLADQLIHSSKKPAPLPLARRHSESTATWSGSAQRRREELMKKYAKLTEGEQVLQLAHTSVPIKNGMEKQDEGLDESEEEAAVPIAREKKRRDSITTKLQMLTVLLNNSPITSPSSSPGFRDTKRVGATPVGLKGEAFPRRNLDFGTTPKSARIITASTPRTSTMLPSNAPQSQVASFPSESKQQQEQDSVANSAQILPNLTRYFGPGTGTETTCYSTSNPVPGNEADVEKVKKEEEITQIVKKAECLEVPTVTTKPIAKVAATPTLRNDSSNDNGNIRRIIPSRLRLPSPAQNPPVSRIAVPGQSLPTATIPTVVVSRIPASPARLTSSNPNPTPSRPGSGTSLKNRTSLAPTPNRAPPTPVEKRRFSAASPGAASHAKNSTTTTSIPSSRIQPTSTLSKYFSNYGQSSTGRNTVKK